VFEIRLVGLRERCGEVQITEQMRSVRRRGGVVELDRLQGIDPSACGMRHERAEEVVELVAIEEGPGIGEERRVVEVERGVGAGALHRGHELGDDAGDDAHLPEAREASEEEVAIATLGAADDVAFAGDDLELDHVIAL
jgi:hypothetical protein